MSWLLQLYKTYEANLEQVGVSERKRNGAEFTLLPICHTTQNAHIEVQIMGNGQFHRASVISGKEEMSTLIPATEEAASRSGSAVYPYPLHDKLSYVAGDYAQFGTNSKKFEHYAAYIEQLRDWAESPAAVDSVRSIYRYLSQGTLITDLIRERVLYVDSQNKLIAKWDNSFEHLSKQRPDIFGAVAGDQEDAFVRFTVYSPHKILEKTWQDQAMYQSFINYYSEKLGSQDICYVMGDRLPSTERHANKIRHAADKAKLISSNDSTGFTYRGRFEKSADAASIGFDVSQKAHNALKWLINRQGKTLDGRVFLVWSDGNPDMIDPLEDTFDLDADRAEKAATPAFTNREYAEEVSKAINGLRHRLGQEPHKDAKVNVLVLDSATTGRMAVLYYRMMEQDDYFDKLKQWHVECSWLHRYRKNEQKDYVLFRGAPSVRDIALAAYGPRADDKLVKGLMERMLPVILDGRPMPHDIVDNAFRKASNPVALEKWEWEKTLSIACALINKRLIDQKHGEGMELALDTQNTSRDYLFGRLLAIADVLERRALGDEQRATNAVRYMNAFVNHPARTWNTLQQCLQPYQAKLGAKAAYLSGKLDEVGALMKVEDYNDEPLKGPYLLGYYSQRHELYQKKSKDGNAELDVDDSEEAMD
ncbi:type I-C CRISPR-associated protein Cas8c/Csd1 [Paenibacillus sp. HB172176]|uniref:type I-C CRISPR-associated protein Cas8c/Csd1 n=1 Tax=Paenibacillus sp. HB172176 TaxID=2493690 RepID=UPI00143AB992|nr:type I-C CRISPR-associated protein Cas8c/Csd1 [Paenibacillus sp. HB172176]